MIRLVKLTIKQEEVEKFKSIFSASRGVILGFKGCEKLSLVVDNNNPQIMFTVSHWENESDLENYRNSDFFKNTWSTVKKMFDAAPEVWSTSIYLPEES